MYKRQEEKKAENPPQNVPEPLPSSETPFKPPALEQHGVSSHTGTVIAETVVTHKPVSYTHLWIVFKSFLPVDTVWLTRRQSAAVHLSDIPLSGIFHLYE